MKDARQMTDIFPTALIVLSDGTVIEGHGFGAQTTNVGEICFNTGLTGYQETLTDPSYAAQIITFTFPHIGNTGTNLEDQECLTPYALGLITREKPTNPSNYRAAESFQEWLSAHNLPGIYGVDTRALTRRIRDIGAPNGVVAVNFDGKFDIPALQQKAASWAGLKDMDLAKIVTTKNTAHKKIPTRCSKVEIWVLKILQNLSYISILDILKMSKIDFRKIVCSKNCYWIKIL